MSLGGIAHLPQPIVGASGADIFAHMRSWSVGIGGVIIVQSVHVSNIFSCMYIWSILNCVPSDSLDHV